MARIRSVKPEFFQHERLYELGEQTGFGAYLRIAWLGLISNCDCRGVFEWRPLRLKVAIFPWDTIDMSRVLEVFATEQMVIRFEWEGKSYGYIPTFIHHQRPHLDEVKKGPQRPEPLNVAGYVRWTHPDTGHTTAQRMPGDAPEHVRSVSGHYPERVSVSLSPDSGSLNPESGGTERTGATAPDPAPSSASPSPEPEPESEPESALTPPADIEASIEAEWKSAATSAGKPPGKASRRDRRIVADAIPDASHRAAIFAAVFAESQPKAFNLVVLDLAAWSDRVKAKASRAEAVRGVAVDYEALPGPPEKTAEERAAIRRRLGLSDSAPDPPNAKSKAEQLEALKS